MDDFEEDDPVELPSDAFKKQMFILRLQSERIARSGAIAARLSGIADTGGLISIVSDKLAKSVVNLPEINSVALALSKHPSLASSFSQRTAALERKWRREFESSVNPRTLDVEPSSQSVQPERSSEGELVGASRLSAGPSKAEAQSFREYSNGVGVTGEFRRVGHVWMLSFGGVTIHLKHRVGFLHIAALLRTPAKAIEAAQLTVGGIEKKASNDAGLPTTDETTIRRVRVELEKTVKEIEDLPAADETQRKRLMAKKASCELYLRANGGLGGSVRKAGGTSARARSKVTNAIHRAVVAIQEQHPVLALHLTKSIKTGIALSYEPEDTVDWIL